MPPKRKRSDRPSGDGGRPSPHRPGETSMAQHDRDDHGGRGRGRNNRGMNRRDSGQGHGRGSSNRQPNQPSAQSSSSFSSQGPPASPSSKPVPPPASPSKSRPPTSPVAAKAAPDPVPGPTSLARPAYRYDNLTDEMIRKWADGGREEVIRHGVQSREDVDITELSSLFQEFIHAVAERRIQPANAGACVKEILGDETSDVIKDSYAFAPHTLFLDSLAIVMDNDDQLYQPVVREFLMATGVSPTLMRQVLDAPILQQLGLIRDTFARLGVRQATNLLYRQANYNLLREETEGYSKLITELFTTNSVVPPPPELAGQTFERIKGLIGTFDLDVGRVLDVTLDVAAAVLIKQYKFFAKFLRVSSWWPRSPQKVGRQAYPHGLPIWATPDYPQWTASEEDEREIIARKLEQDIAFWERARTTHLAAFFELGGRQIADSDHQQAQLTNGHGSEGAVADAERQWIQDTKTLPPSGNRVAAQLLGFKLLFYNSDLRDPADVLPANLLYLAALLVKIGFISLVDLYPHLSPPDEEMERVREEELKKIEKEERASKGGSMNALLMAGVLPQGDDDNPSSTGPGRREPLKKADPDPKQTAAEEAESKAKLPDPLEQKVSLLIQLLTIGALPEALFILGRFPWIPETFPEVLGRLHRILHVTLDKVYNESRPIPVKSTECFTKEIPDLDQSGVTKGSVRLGRLPVKKVWRWPFPDKNDNNESQTYRFYWDEWADNIPVCQTVDDIFTLCSTLLNISGVNIGKDDSLLSKLASIGAKSLADDNSEVNMNRWHDLLRRLLLPALSHTKANASVVNAIWDLLRRYPLVTRYTMYAEWFEGQTSRLPAMKTAFTRATSETRGTMKRVSLTNLSEMAKQLAKISYSSPGIVFRVAFEQLESYPNLIDAFVECAKYFTDLSYDVLIWSLMSSLGKSRSRTQADHALTTSKWLTALSRFTGRVFRRYSVLDPVPVLYYVNDQLHQGNSTDLIILKEFMSSMGGIVDAVDFTDYQIFSMAGGACLRQHTLIRGQDRRFENVKTSKRLIQALTDSKLAVRFLINLAQYRQAAIFQVPEDEAHIKYLSTMVDDSHQILVQYLDFLWSNLEPTEFVALVPSIPELMTAYGLDTSLAFLIGRASLAHRMCPWKPKTPDAIKEKAQVKKMETDREGDVAMSGSKPSADGSLSQDALPSDDQVRGRPSPEASPTTNPKPSQKTDDPSVMRATLQPIIDVMRETGRPEVWNKISPELYTTFWALSLGDLFCPEDIYKQEMQRVESESTALSRDRSDMTRRGQDRKNEKKSELMTIRIGLLQEGAEHMLRNAKWKFYLAKGLQTSFPDPKIEADSISDMLLEQCFIPRLILSPADTEYTYKFIKAMHEGNAPSFKLMSLYDRLFNSNRLRALIFTSTVREAEYLGRFLKLILEDLSRWHKNDPVPADKDSKASRDQPRIGVYEKEGKGPADQPRSGFALTMDDNGKPATFVDHAQFRDMLFRWHKNLNIALKSCLGGTEWMHIRNGITILKCVLDFFPAVDFMATQFSTQLQKISKQEAAAKTAPDNEEGHRVDLSVAAQGALSELQKRKSKWVMVQAFRPNKVSSGEDATMTSPDDEKDGASQPESDKSTGANSNLRATAPDFAPQSPKPANKKTTVEEEDGEVQDGKDGRLQPPTGGRVRGTSAPKESLPAKPSGREKENPRLDEPLSGSLRSSVPLGPQASAYNGQKGDTRPHMLPDRPGLPSRPDVPIPGPYSSERYPQPQGRGHERRDGREPREPREPRATRDPRDQWDVREAREPPRDPREVRDQRESRPAEAERPGRSREYADRRGPEQGGELPPRPGTNDRERPHRGRTLLNDTPGQSPVPPPSGPADSQEPAMNPERAALFAKEDGPRPNRGPEAERQPRNRPQGPAKPMEGANPERVAITSDRDRSTPNQTPRGDPRDRNPRTQSPRRGGRPGPEHGPSPTPFDERHGRTYPQDPRAAGRNPRDRSPPPMGANYRGERGMEPEGDRGHLDKARDAPGFHRPSSRGPEPEHRPAHQDQNYGRLNPVPAGPEIPSGPRGRGGGAARGSHGAPSSTPNRSDGRFGGVRPPRAPTPEKQPPTGPSSSSRGRRGGYEHGNGPSTPMGTPGGPHSDRGRNFGPGQDMPTPGSANSTPQTGVHPARIAQLGGPSHQPPPPPPPPPGPPPHGPGRHSMGPTNTPDRGNMGGRQSSGNMAASSPMEAGVPTGPSSSNDKVKGGGGGRRQLQGINSTLKQASVTDASRSSGGRMNQPRQMLGNSDVQVLTGGSPGPTPERNERIEALSRGPANGEEGSGRGEHERGRRDRESRSNKASRRSSRDRERERSPGRERESKDHGEYRERRSTGGAEGAGKGGASKDRESRRSGRDGAGREPTGPAAGGGRESMGGRHRGEAGAGGGARGAEEWGEGAGPGPGPRPGRSGPRDGGLRPDERRDDRGRKRRSEEGVGNLSSEREKRPRR